VAVSEHALPHVPDGLSREAVLVPVKGLAVLAVGEGRDVQDPDPVVQPGLLDPPGEELLAY